MALGEHYVGLFANALPFIGDVIRSLIVPSSSLAKNRYHGQRDILNHRECELQISDR